MSFNRILCPVTFSPASRHVVHWAASFAARYDGEVRLFHVLDEQTRVEDQCDTASCGFDDGERKLNELFALARRLPRRVRVSAAVVRGSARDEILRHAGLVRADLIAMGLTSRGGSGSALVRHVAIDACCPVLAIPQVDGLRSGPAAAPINGIVCAVNFLPASLAAADYAFALHRDTSAPVTVVHVLPEHWNRADASDALSGDAHELLEHHFRQLLHVALRDGRDDTAHCRTVVAAGTSCVEIVRLARLRGADLIVTGIDRTGADQPFGSTTACVMQSAPCPVLLVPPRIFRKRSRPSRAVECGVTMQTTRRRR